MLTHRRRGRLCPRRGLRAGWGVAQEGLLARGGDPVPIWSGRIKVTGGASRGRQRERARGQTSALSTMGSWAEPPPVGRGVRGKSPLLRPVLDTPAHQWDLRPTQPHHPRHFSQPRPPQPPGGARALPPSTSRGLTWGFQAAPQHPTPLTHHGPGLSQAPGALQNRPPSQNRVNPA